MERKTSSNVQQRDIIVSRRRRFRFVFTHRPKMLFPTTLRVLARRGGGPRGRGSLMSSPFLEVYYLLIVIEPERMCFFFFSLSLRFPIRCVESNVPRVVAPLLEEDVFEREKFPPFLRSKVSLSRFCVSDATLTFFSLLRLRNNRAVCSSNSSSSSIDRVLGLDLTGGDDIIAKVSGAVDGAKRVRAHPRVLQRRHWYRSRHDQLVRCGHGRQKRESYRKRGRVKDDAVHGGI